jgi:hypothetical protein
VGSPASRVVVFATQVANGMLVSNTPRATADHAGTWKRLRRVSTDIRILPGVVMLLGSVSVLILAFG